MQGEHGGYRVRVIPEDFTDSAKVYLIRSVDGKLFIARFVEKDGQQDIEFEYLPEGSSNVKPTFVLRQGSAGLILAAFASAASAFGVEPESVALVRGKLEAVLDHLKDMRALVFKKDDN